MTKHTCTAVLLIALILLVPGHAAAAAPTPPVPLDSWVYPALDKLQGYGLDAGALEGDRPWTRAEVGRLVAAAARRNDGTLPELAVSLLTRLQREFAGQPDATATERDYLRPVSRTRLVYAFRDGPVSSYPGTNASQFPLVYNRDGIGPAAGHNGEAWFAGSGRYGLLLADWRPLVELREDDGSELKLVEGGLTLGLGPMELFAGRRQLWWGQGRHGSLILSSNARPLDMVRLTNPRPARLPWLLRYLGPFRFDLFLSRLEPDRVVPEPWLGGLRFSLRPLPWLELGAQRTTLFGGDGQPDVGADDFLEILSGVNPSPGQHDNANSLASVDARLRLPFLWGAQLYGELGGEDEANHWFSKEAWLAGIHLPRLLPGGLLGLRAEYADLAENAVWYRHSTYRSGYTYENRLLGHHAGGDARDLYLEVSAWATPDCLLRLSVDFERRGRRVGPVEEKHVQPALEARWQVTDRYELRGAYAFDRVENFGRVAGENRDLHYGTVSLEGTWGR